LASIVHFAVNRSQSGYLSFSFAKINVHWHMASCILSRSKRFEHLKMTCHASVEGCYSEVVLPFAKFSKILLVKRKKQAVISKPNTLKKRRKN